jgi:hypothetical protein
LKDIQGAKLGYFDATGIRQNVNKHLKSGPPTGFIHPNAGSARAFSPVIHQLAGGIHSFWQPSRFNGSYIRPINHKILPMIRSICLSLACIGFSVFLRAQTTVLTGKITDEQGNVLPLVTV